MPAPADRPWRTPLAATAFVAAIGIALIRVTSLSDLGGFRLGASWALIDFRSNVYYPVRAFVEGANPYDRVAYLARYPAPEGFPPFLPSTLLIHLPFGFMPLELAHVAYTVVVIALIVGLARVALRDNGNKGWAATYGMAALVAISRPGQWALLLGQVALQAVLGSWAALRYAHVPWASGLALGFATFKPTFGVPLAVLMFARGDVKAVGAGVLAGIALTLPPAAILAYRAGGFAFYAQDQANAYAAWTGDSDSEPSTTLYRTDVVALAGRLAGRPLAHLEELVITAVVIAVAAFLVRRLRRVETTPAADRPLSDAIICLAILLCVHHLDYDLLLLAFPLVALVYHRVPGMMQDRRVRRVTLALFAVLGANYASTQSVLDGFNLPAAGAQLLMSINSLVLLAIFATYAVAALRATSARRVNPPVLVPTGHQTMDVGMPSDAIGHVEREADGARHGR